MSNKQEGLLQPTTLPSCQACVPVAVQVGLLQGVPGGSSLREVAGCWGEPCRPTANSKATRTCLNRWSDALLLRRLLQALLHRGTLQSVAMRPADCPGSTVVLPCNLTAGCISATCSPDPWKTQSVISTLSLVMRLIIASL